MHRSVADACCRLATGSPASRRFLGPIASDGFHLLGMMACFDNVLQSGVMLAHESQVFELRFMKQNYGSYRRTCGCMKLE